MEKINQCKRERDQVKIGTNRPTEQPTNRPTDQSVSQLTLSLPDDPSFTIVLGEVLLVGGGGWRKEDCPKIWRLVPLPVLLGREEEPWREDCL